MKHDIAGNEHSSTPQQMTGLLNWSGMVPRGQQQHQQLQEFLTQLRSKCNNNLLVFQYVWPQQLGYKRDYLSQYENSQDFPEGMFGTRRALHTTKVTLYP